MIGEWLEPILAWTGLAIVPFLLLVVIILLVINILRG